MLTSGFALIAVAALLAGAALQIVLALAGYRARRHERQQVAHVRALQKEIQALHADLAAAGRRLAVLERQPARPLAEARPPAPPVRREPLDPAYELAAKLARKGVDERELMDTCGLSRGEVDLITVLHRLGQDTGTQADGGRAGVTAARSAAPA